ncbi:hypothetical protein [Cupriavidus necator]|nr:hypothetical protein [Cupriavidus necator]
MKATSQTQGSKKRLTEILRDIAFWIAVSLGVVCLSGLYEWLDSMLY